MRPLMSKVERDEWACQHDMKVRGQRLRTYQQAVTGSVHPHYLGDYQEALEASTMPITHDWLRTPQLSALRPYTGPALRWPSDALPNTFRTRRRVTPR